MDKIPYLFKENFFSEKELEEIFTELDYLNNAAFLLPPECSGSSVFPDTLNPKKKNKGLFYSTFYANMNISTMWRMSRKIFSGYVEEYSKLHLSNRAINSTNSSTLLLSYYEKSDYYLPHTDYSTATVLYWFFREPKKFSGGELKFEDTGEVVTPKNNSVIIFPSYASHSVSEVFMEDQYLNKKLGRYCITQFFLMDPSLL